MLTPSSVHAKLFYQPNGFPVYTTESGILLTFEPSEYDHESGRNIANKTWKGIAQEYDFLNPNKYDDTSSVSEDWFAVKYNTKRGDSNSYKHLFAPMSMQQLCEKELHIQQLIDAVKDFIATRDYKQYIENHSLSSGGPGGGGYQPEYRSFLSSLSSFLSVINYYKNVYQQTMKHISILHRAGHNITALFLDHNNISDV